MKRINNLAAQYRRFAELNREHEIRYLRLAASSRDRSTVVLYQHYADVARMLAGHYERKARAQQDMEPMTPT